MGSVIWCRPPTRAFSAGEIGLWLKSYLSNRNWPGEQERFKALRVTSRRNPLGADDAPGIHALGLREQPDRAFVRAYAQPPKPKKTCLRRSDYRWGICLR